MEGSCLPEDEWFPADLLHRFGDLFLPIPESQYEPWGEGPWVHDIDNAVGRLFKESEGRSRGEPAADFDYHGAVEDPLAFYVPYPSDVSRPKKWGIYFRAHRMLDDFKKFHSRLPRFIPTDFSWRVYVVTVFWHEMAHHAVQDAWLIQEGYKSQPSSPPLPDYSGYSLMPRQDEEGLCEYMAFTAVERGASLPGTILRNLPPRHLPTNAMFFLTKWDLDRYFFSRPGPRPKIPLVPRGPSMKPDYFRIYALCALYKHWGRNSDPVYRPRVTRAASRAVGPLWSPLWDAHRRGAPVITSRQGEADLIWGKVYVTYK